MGTVGVGFLDGGVAGEGFVIEHGTPILTDSFKVHGCLGFTLVTSQVTND